MSTLTASSLTAAGGLRSDVAVNGRHTIVTDEPDSLGGTDLGPAPHELLPAMLASCISTMIALYAQQRDWHVGDVRVDVSYDKDTSPRQVTVDVHLPDGLTQAQVERLTRVANACPARRALEASFTFDEPCFVCSDGTVGSTPAGGLDLPDGKEAGGRNERGLRDSG
jgi:putative redox protein